MPQSQTNFINIVHTLILVIIRFANLIHSQTHIITGIEGLILHQHNQWRSLLANGHIDDHPNAANMEKLLWEYNIQQLAENYSNQCDTSISPPFDINTLNTTNFAFEADFTKYSFGHNTASIQYNKHFNFTSDTQQLFNITKNLINQWFQQHNQYDFGDSVSNDTANYFNAAGAVTRYIGCAIHPCNIFLCKECICIPKDICIRYFYLNCFYFPSIQHSPAIEDNQLYLDGIPCTECSTDRDSICDNGLCAGCPSQQFYRCQNDNSCEQTPDDPCDDDEFAENCPQSCDDTCHDLTGSNDFICRNQPLSPVYPTVSPTFEPTEAPTNSPTMDPISMLQTLNPTINPSDLSTITPSISPTTIPTMDPTTFPTNFPTYIPTYNPSIFPFTHSPTTDEDTLAPTTMPTVFPSGLPSKTPTESPTKIPTNTPSINPTQMPTEMPTNIPTYKPSISPLTHSPTTDGETFVPTVFPSDLPSKTPTVDPTENPSKSPTEIPTNIPSINPTNIPTEMPTNIPTYTPTISPLADPSISPSTFPSQNPSISPSQQITDFPTKNPSILPSDISSEVPSEYPVKISTISPSKYPTLVPTKNPTKYPLKPTKDTPDSDSSSDELPDYEFKCGINFLPFSEYTQCTYKCNGGRMKRTRLVYYYGCYSNSITYLGTQVISKQCNTHKCNVE